MKDKFDRPDDNELLMRAIKNATSPPGRNDYPRWACVRDLFEVGSKVAMQLCLEAKLNPHDYLDGPVCDVCPVDDWEDV
jgi:hypothetical protein